MNHDAGYLCIAELSHFMMQNLATGDQDTRTQNLDVAVAVAAAEKPSSACPGQLEKLFLQMTMMVAGCMYESFVEELLFHHRTSPRKGA